MMKILAALLVFGPRLYAEIHVPGDHSSLQAAIFAAAADEVIVVAGGPTAGVIIDKPLTIVFEATGAWGIGCGVEPACTACHDDNAFRLAGPGAGRVTIVGYEGLSKDCFFPAPAIEGTGFDELRLVDCSIRIGSGAFGIGHGAHGVDVDVPFVVLSGCTIRAKGSNSDHCTGSLFEDVTAGVKALGATVLVLDSVVRGGDGGLLCCIACACPTLPDPAYGGTGGPGIIAREVFHASSSISGGRGSAFKAFLCCDPYDPAGQPIPCGKQADGPMIVAAAVHALGGTLRGQSTASAGTSYTLEWDLPGPAAFLFLSSAVAKPATAGASAPGFVLLEKGSITFLGSIATGAPSAVTFALPPHTALIGVGFGFQAFDATLGLTRPVFGVVIP